ncbi:MAG TPA: response regulator [Bacteroidales bacterium]|nr:response regulator [Bacteroidales bacterium]HQB20772.1 response regulator [Bacteroidales bacterium]
MKVLLIDDKAKKGWEQLLKLIFPFQNMVIESATTYVDAIDLIQNEYDIILLDIRLEANDYKKINIEDFSGYKILKKIKRNFSIVNFSTPIILLTASNKIWNIDAFKEYGVDSYFIKEHPDYIFDKKASNYSYEIFRDNFENLLFDIGPRRKDVWRLSNEIINKINKHYYFNGSKKDKNIKNRIIDKLKLGYAYLFKGQTKLEKDLLKTNNESLAFIIYFSILEEIVKGFSDISTWNTATYERNINWKFKNKEYFIEKNKDGITVNITFDKKKAINYSDDTNEYSKYSEGLINLSEQMYSLIAAYSDGDNYTKLSNSFQEINKFRNETDYIHSNVKNIFTKELIHKDTTEDAYNNCCKVLELINDILSLI